MTRDEKLVVFALAFGGIWHAVRIVLTWPANLPSGLFPLIYASGIGLLLLLRSFAIPEWVGWIGLAGVAGSAAVLNPGSPWTLPSLALTAPGAVLIVVALVHFVRLRSHRNRGLSRIGYSGLALSLSVGTLAVASGFLDDPRSTAVFVAVLVALYAAESARLREYVAESIERRHTLSATIIAKNEQDRIRDCLESIHGWVDEIVVLDSGSTDDTVRIVREYTDRVYETDWPGYGVQKQRALEKATGDWVLSIDADEQVTPRLRRDIDEVLRGKPRHVGYCTPWAVTIYGRRLDFGRSARAPLRLFVRKGSKFTPAQVHETVELPPGTMGRLDGRLLHFTHRNYRHAMDKSREYAWLKSQEKHARGKRTSVIYAFVRAIWDFFVIYGVRLGFLDGQHGLLMAANYAIYAFNKYAGLWTLQRVRPEKPPRQ